MRRVWLRAGVLALGAIGVVAALTVYFSSESVPPCLVSGAPKWHAPRHGTHALDRAHLRAWGPVMLLEPLGVAPAFPL